MRWFCLISCHTVFELESGNKIYSIISVRNHKNISPKFFYRKIRKLPRNAPDPPATSTVASMRPRWPSAGAIPRSPRAPSRVAPPSRAAESSHRLRARLCAGARHGVRSGTFGGWTIRMTVPSPRSPPRAVVVARITRDSSLGRRRVEDEDEDEGGHSNPSPAPWTRRLMV